MMASEDRDENLPSRLRIPVLSMLLGFVVVYALVVSGLLSINEFWGPKAWETLGALAMNLLIVGTIWGLSRVKPSGAKAAALSVLLGFAALLGIGATVAIVKNMHAAQFHGLWYWKTLCLLAANLLICAGAIWGLSRVKPWKAFKGTGEPVSPATRRTNLLFGLSGLISVLGVLTVILGTRNNEIPFGVWSNSQNVSPGFALVAIAIWLLSVAIAWWWYFSADEHERRANDVGFLAGGGLFMAATPVWWIGSRAGLLPPPDAMILWFATIMAMGVGWFWYRNR